jgi:hypothetical protein
MTSEGFVDVEVVEGSFTQAMFAAFIKNKVVGEPFSCFIRL